MRNTTLLHFGGKNKHICNLRKRRCQSAHIDTFNPIIVYNQDACFQIILHAMRKIEKNAKHYRFSNVFSRESRRKVSFLAPSTHRWSKSHATFPE